MASTAPEGNLYADTDAEAQSADFTEDVARNRDSIDLARIADVSSAKSDASTALSTANAYAGQIAQANTTAGSAVAIAEGAASEVDEIKGPIETRLGAVETAAGYAPGDATDAAMTNIALQPDTEFRTALNAQTVQAVHPQTYAGTAVDLHVAYGQSNAMGYAGSSAGDPAYKAPGVTVWDGTTTIPLTNYMPTTQGETSTGGAWVAFANEYAQRTGRQAILINAAQGSASIADLSKGAANTLYSGLVDWVTAVKAHIVANGGIVGKVVVHFVQGERDSALNTSVGTYEAALSTLWADLKLDIGADLMALYTVGFYNTDLKMYGQVIQGAQRRFSKDNPDVVTAFDDLESLSAHGLKRDDVHLNQKGYNLMGRAAVAPVVDALFKDESHAQDPLLSRQGTLNLDGSQEWGYYGGRLVGPDFTASTLGPNAVTGTQIALVSGSHIAVGLTDDLDYILEASADVRARIGTLSWAAGSSGLRAVVNKDIETTKNNDGRTLLRIFFVAPVTVRVNLATQVLDTSILGVDLSSMFTVTWGPGTATIRHPRTQYLATATAQGGTPLITTCSTTGALDTTVRCWDTAGAPVDGIVSVDFPMLDIPPALLPDADVSYRVIGTKKRPS